MTIDEARDCLQGAGFMVAEEDRLPNGTGTQLKVTGPGFSAVSVNIYDKGTHNVQGNNKSQVEDALSACLMNKPAYPSSLTHQITSPASSGSVAPETDPSNSAVEKERIFVVHGHDEKARMELHLTLLQLGLEPFVLANTSGGGLTIIEALEKEIGPDADRVRFGIVLLTPDDMGYSKAEGPDSIKPRARQNVVLEMGMLISAIGRKNVAILKKGIPEVPSDANGIIYIPFGDSVKEVIPKLCDRLIQAGFQLESANIVKAATFG